jgi:hypothetical protein
MRSLSKLLFEQEDEEAEDDIFGGGDDEDVENIFGDESEEDEEPEEGEEPEEDEEPEDEEPVDIAAAVRGSIDVALDGIFADFHSASLKPKVNESLARRIFEADDVLDIDVIAFTEQVADLIRNYTVRMDVPAIIYLRAKHYLETTFGPEIVVGFDEAIKAMDLKIPIGGDERGPATTRGMELPGETSPMLGPIAIGASGEGVGGGI